MLVFPYAYAIRTSMAESFPRPVSKCEEPITIRFDVEMTVDSAHGCVPDTSRSSAERIYRLAPPHRFRRPTSDGKLPSLGDDLDADLFKPRIPTPAFDHASRRRVVVSW
jgi:hypothetical protein